MIYMGLEQPFGGDREGLNCHYSFMFSSTFLKTRFPRKKLMMLLSFCPWPYNNHYKAQLGGPSYLMGNKPFEEIIRKK